MVKARCMGLLRQGRAGKCSNTMAKYFGRLSDSMDEEKEGAVLVDCILSNGGIVKKNVVVIG